MRVIERRLRKLEKTCNGAWRSYEAISDEVLELRVTALLKRASAIELSPEEQAIISIRPPARKEGYTDIADETLSVRLARDLAKLLGENGRADDWLRRTEHPE